MTDIKIVEGSPDEFGRHGPLRILFVEDDPMTSLAYLKILRMNGFAVQHVGSYQDAIELADGEFDLVLSDIALPDGSGWDVMRHIRERWTHIPGIALSGFGSAEDMKMSREAGFAVHLTKPVTFKLLKETIAMVVRR